MAIIRFKATRKLHDSGFRILEKSGDLQHDIDAYAHDGVWIDVTKPGRVFIDCERSGTYQLHFSAEKVAVENPDLLTPNKERSTSS